MAGGLRARAAAGQPVRVGIIGAGTFARMYLAQARRTTGIHVVGIADLDRSRVALEPMGWPAGQTAAPDMDTACAQGTTYVTEDVHELIDGPIEVVVEATGSPAAGIAHALAAIERGRHVVMVTVEADVLAGPLLAARAAEAGVVYSLAYGDQPALICELVDWAFTCGFEVVAAGKGTRYLPAFVQSTPETVWDHYGIDRERAAEAGYNTQMYNSFLDGTKSVIEMAAVANATGLRAAPSGLGFPPAGVSDLPAVTCPVADGGALECVPAVEVVSSVRRDGTPVPDHLRWGMYVTFRAADDYISQRLADYGIVTDPSGRYASLHRPTHFIGLELGVSVASAAIAGVPTGAPTAFVADAVAMAKRDLRAGERLDGEGGYTVHGHLLPAEDSLAQGALPIGLAHDVTMRQDLARGEVVRWDDVDIDEGAQAVSVRRELERDFAPDRNA